MSDYVEMKKWRRLAVISMLGLFLSVIFNAVLVHRVHEDENWMVKAYVGLEVCSQILHGQNQ